MKRAHAFDFLDGTIRVLMVDDQPELLESFLLLAEDLPLLNATGATSAREAWAQIEGPCPPHVCIYDLGLNDISGDEFFLMKHFGSSIAFIVATGRESTQTAFACARRGAFDFVAKPLLYTRFDFWERIHAAFLANVFNLLGYQTVRPVISAARILVTNQPQSVTEWASLAGVTETYLRRIWSEHFGSSPKLAHFVRTLYGHAFEYSRLLVENSLAPEQLIENLPYARLKKYWTLNYSPTASLIGIAN